MGLDESHVRDRVMEVGGKIKRRRPKNTCIRTVIKILKEVGGRKNRLDRIEFVGRPAIS